MINNSYVKFNGQIYRQNIGIPMGIDPAPYIANLFLHYFEYNFIWSLINSGDLTKARSLAYTTRYLDDLLSINDNHVFEECHNIIYPNEMKLSKTDIDDINANYLDLNISINNSKFLCCKLYDKRHEFPFKVINYPNIKYSNNPKLPSYGIFTSQLIRVTRACSDSIVFDVAITKLVNDFINRGFSGDVLSKQFQKFLTKYHREWGKFGVTPTIPNILTQVPK